MVRSSSEQSFDEHAFFLPYEKNEAVSCPACRTKSKKLQSLKFWLPWTLNFCLLVALVLVSYKLEQQSRISHIVSPARKAIDYTQYKYQSGFDPDVSAYQGFPSEEKDELWSSLYTHGMTVAITEEEHAAQPDTTERYPVKGHESEYMVGLDVFHQLHCLNHLRMAFYPHHYNMSMFKPDGSVNQNEWMHVDHCIDSVRQSLVCNADVSVVSYKWHNKTKIMEPVLSGTHQCRDFSKIQQWVKERYVQLPHKRLHIEQDGSIQDYSDLPNPEDIPLEKLFTGFNHTAEDF